MKLRRLIELRHWRRRYRLCRACFTDPGYASWRLAFLTKDPFTLRTIHGQELPFEWADHPFWDWLAARAGRDIALTREGDWLVRPADGIAALLRPGTSDADMFREVVVEDQYALAGLPDTLNVVLDVGANIGLFGCALLAKARRVIFVEPDAGNVAQIRKNITLHGGGDNTEVLALAAAGRSGETVDFYSHQRKSCCNTMLPDCFDPDEAGQIHIQRVETISLRDLIDHSGAERIDLLKCDVEGAEYAIIAAAAADGCLRRVDCLLMEVHVRNVEGVAAAEAMLDQIRACGFSIQRTGPGERGSGRGAARAGWGFNIICRHEG
ncbi:MAG: FkbM family methyltransferase [Magnetococcales bacterium]|nr:FkbM family methyltransferase [Magnetococcales bacterium]